jgi:hypothetical protein
MTGFVEPNFAHAHRALRDRTAMATRVATEPRFSCGPSVESLDKFRGRLVRTSDEQVLKSRHSIDRTRPVKPSEQLDFARCMWSSSVRVYSARGLPTICMSVESR